MKVGVSKVVEADCPEDGGKWAIYCEHLLSNGDVIVGAILQDTNKRRLSEWRTATWEDGLTHWCGICQEQHEEEVK